MIRIGHSWPLYCLFQSFRKKTKFKFKFAPKCCQSAKVKVVIKRPKRELIKKMLMINTVSRFIALEVIVPFICWLRNNEPNYKEQNLNFRI